MDICVTLFLQIKGEKKAIHQWGWGGEGGGSSLLPQ